MALFQLDEKKIGDDNRLIKFKNKSNYDNLREKKFKREQTMYRNQ